MKSSPADLTSQKSAIPSKGAQTRYSRVLLKLSGESLCKEGEHGIDSSELSWIAQEIKKAYDEGVQMGIVVGGGNIWRGANRGEAIGRVTADYMGMLATVMNAMALQDALEDLHIPTRVQTAIEISKRLDEVRFMDSIRDRLKVMDATALTLCMENQMPVLVFDLHVKGNIALAVGGKKVGTLIKE